MPRDTLFAVAVVGAVALMVLPVPAALLDVLLLLSLALSLTLLVSVLSLSEPERFTSLPTILLLSTLFRLSLNISTTRLILGYGQAPEVVHAFGEFVVGGNPVVGAVMFIILTIIQFLVIAKGAERVAEVAARFALDAMPGRQMSIDADLRAGMLTVSDARERRRELQRECRLYGALDGAMKFVKGDAIAGLCIIVLNILVGICVGSLYHGLSLSESVHRFTVFTIGDGLVSQIPALLVAISAGIVITRVSEREETLLHREISQQLFGQPKVIALVGAVLFGCACLPGFPVGWSMLLGGVYFAGAVRLRLALKKETERAGVAQPQLRAVPAIVINLSLKLARVIHGAGAFDTEIQRVREETLQRWGVLLPEFSFAVTGDEERLALEIRIHGAESSRHELSAGEAGEAWQDTCRIIQEVIEQRLGAFIDNTQTRTLFELYEAVVGDLINAVAKTPEDMTLVTRVLRELIRERVPVTELRNIIQAIAEYRSGLGGAKRAAGQVQQERDIDELLLFVRSRIPWSVSGRFVDSQRHASVWLLSAELDYLVARAFLSGLGVDPHLAERIQSAAAESGEGIVVAVTKYARPLVARILSETPGVKAVLAVEDLPEDVVLDIEGELGAEEVRKVA